jgi:hypothetical protein
LHNARLKGFNAVNDDYFFQHDALLIWLKNPLGLWFNNRLRQRILAEFSSVHRLA